MGLRPPAMTKLKREDKHLFSFLFFPSTKPLLKSYYFCVCTVYPDTISYNPLNLQLHTSVGGMFCNLYIIIYFLFLNIRKVQCVMIQNDFSVLCVTLIFFPCSCWHGSEDSPPRSPYSSLSTWTTGSVPKPF